MERETGTFYRLDRVLWDLREGAFWRNACFENASAGARMKLEKPGETGGSGGICKESCRRTNIETPLYVTMP